MAFMFSDGRFNKRSSISGNQITPGMLFMTAFPAALCLAMASWYLVERPFLRLKSPGRQKPAADALYPGKDGLVIPAWL